MNEMKNCTIYDLQRYVRSYGLPKLTIQSFVQIYEHGLEALPGKPTPYVKDHRKVNIEIWRDMGREDKVVILHVEILMCH